MYRLPSVVIVGRANVGKSSLFNRLSDTVKSITFDYAGVTRDCIKDVVTWQGHAFELVDTGGVSLSTMHDQLAEQARHAAFAMIDTADLLLFVVDGSTGPIAEDFAIATFLHKKGKPVLLVINKMDTRLAEEHQYMFQRLGFKESLGVSCQHATGIGDLLITLVKRLPERGQEYEKEQAAFSVVLLGKPNVGKSSLLNLLAQEERTLVSPIPGTTREAVSTSIKFYQEDITITDTPGVRKKHAVTDPLEQCMVHSSLRALERGNIVLLLIDASTGQLSDQELKLAYYAFDDLHRAVILVFNKQDIVTETTKQQMLSEQDLYDRLMKKVESISISCVTKKNIGKILPLVQEVWERYNRQLSDAELTMLCQQALTETPLYHQQDLLKVFRVRQIKTAPITLLMIVNQPRWFGDSQKAFFENRIRKAFNLKGVPLKFLLRTSS